MERKLEFRGSLEAYFSWKRKVNMEYKFVRNTFEHRYPDEVGETQIHTNFLCTPYTQEEEEEYDTHGDVEWDDYTMSDSYREDCKSEQWDWLKNEMG